MASRPSDRDAVSLGQVTTLLVASRGLRFAIALVNSILVARVLGVDRLGAYAYAMGLAALFGLLPNMGIATVVTRSVARDPVAGAGILRTALMGQALVSLGTLLVIPGVAALLPGQPVPLLYVVLAAAQLTVGTLSWPYLGLLSGRVRYDRVAIAELLSALAGTLCLAAAALSLRTPAGFLGAQVVAASISTLAARQLARPFFSMGGSPHSLSSLFRNGLPFGGAAAADSLYRRLDILLLGQMSSTVALGLYNVAYKPTNLIVYFGTTMAGPLYPLMVRDPEPGAPQTLRRTLFALGVLAPVMTLSFSGLAGPILRSLYGPAFTAASPVMVVLVWSAAANWLYAPLSSALQAKGRERAWLGVLVSGLVLNAGGNLWAIPRWGALGAAGATLVSEVAVLFFAGALACRLFHTLPPLQPVAIGAGATAAAGWLLHRTSPVAGPVPATLAAVAVYGLFLLVFRVVRVADLRPILGWVAEATSRIRSGAPRSPRDSGEVPGAYERGG